MTDSIRLECTEGGSNKFYEIQIVPVTGGFLVNAANGRIGSTPTAQPKTKAPVERAEAQKIFDKLVNEKRAKGYKPVGGDVTALVGGAEKEDSGLRPQLLNNLDAAELDRWLDDSNQIMQLKHDGRRLMVKIGAGVVTGANRKGEVIPLPAELVAELLTHDWYGSNVLDGELVGDKYYVFDLLEASGDIRHHPYEHRLRTLEAHWANYPSNRVEVIASTFTPLEKRLAFEMLKAIVADPKQAKKPEGVVFKDRNAPFSEGRPNKGGPQRKFKFWATADVVIVPSQSKAVRSAGMGLWNNGQLVYVGQVTIPANYPIPTEGQVAQVRYLYAYKGGSIYQPQYEGVRDDKDAAECHLDQLKYKAEGSDEE